VRGVSGVGLARWGVALLLCFCLGQAGAARAANAKPDLLVAAASDLTFAFRELIPAFEREHGVTLTLSLGSSGQLAQQIEHGAPYDVFFSAGEEYIEGLRAKGKVRAETITPYAQGRLVLATRGDRIPPAGLADLARGPILRLALANPVHAPYGRAAKEALQRAGVWDRLEPKLVIGENVAQLLPYLRSGNVDLAVLALSMIQKGDVRFTPIEPGLHRPITQVAAVTTRSGQPELARAFIHAVVGPGRPLMKRFGFLVPGEF
jgi:molybdate transport system substrate-binding protein